MTNLQADVAAVKELVKLAGDLERQINDGDGAYPQDYHDVHTEVVVATHAIERLLGIVSGVEAMSREHGANCRKGEFTRSIVGPGQEPEEYPCTCGADELKALLDREK